MKDYFEKFESIDEFAEVVNTRSTTVYYKGLTELASQNDDIKFTSTESYEVATKLLLEGDKNMAKRLSNELKTIKLNNSNMVCKNVLYGSQNGFIPNVGAVMSGHPLNMINIKQQKFRNSKVITLALNCAVPGTVSVDAITSYNVRLLTIISNLEKQGYRINLYIGSISYMSKSKNNVGFFVKIKDAGKPLNILNVAYPLINPSFNRRHKFRWLETCENAKCRQYGYALSKDKATPIACDILGKHTLYLGVMDNVYKSKDEIIDELENQRGCKF